MRPDPKPEKRYRASKREWEDMHRAFRGVPCRACGRRPFESLHHVYPRGQGGDDVVVNLFPVCGSGTTGCHGLIESHDRVTRARVRANLNDANRLYLTYKLGHGAQAWLDSQYPELEVAA